MVPYWSLLARRMTQGGTNKQTNKQTMEDRSLLSLWTVGSLSFAIIVHNDIMLIYQHCRAVKCAVFRPYYTTAALGQHRLRHMLLSRITRHVEMSGYSRHFPTAIFLSWSSIHRERIFLQPMFGWYNYCCVCLSLMLRALHLPELRGAIILKISGFLGNFPRWRERLKKYPLSNSWELKYVSDILTFFQRASWLDLGSAKLGWTTKVG